jgi:hypothetical protein
MVVWCFYYRLKYHTNQVVLFCFVLLGGLWQLVIDMLYADLNIFFNI